MSSFSALDFVLGSFLAHFLHPLIVLRLVKLHQLVQVELWLLEDLYLPDHAVVLERENL